VFLFVDNEVRASAVESYMDYVRKVVPTVPEFGGKYLCRQGPMHVVPSPPLPSGDDKDTVGDDKDKVEDVVTAGTA
jgi:hypothetical protein